MEKIDINTDNKPFTSFLLSCHTIIETRPLTIKDMYPVRESSVRLNWIHDNNITSNGFLNSHKRNV